MKRVRILSVYLIFLLLSSNSFAGDKWEKQDIVLESVAVTLLMADWLQTRDIAYQRGKYKEIGPARLFIGANPSVNAVDVLNTLSIAMHLIVAEILPSEYRKYWSCIYIGIEAAVVSNNHEIGLRMRFD